MSKDLNNNNFAKYLIEKIPEFISKYESHLNENEEVIPNVLMAEFARFFINLVNGKNGDLMKKCSEILDTFLDSEDIELQNLVYVSFLENLNQDGSFEEVKTALSEKLKKALETIVD